MLTSRYPWVFRSLGQKGGRRGRVRKWKSSPAHLLAYSSPPPKSLMGILKRIQKLREKKRTEKWNKKKNQTFFWIFLFHLRDTRADTPACVCRYIRSISLVEPWGEGPRDAHSVSCGAMFSVHILYSFIFIFWVPTAVAKAQDLDTHWRERASKPPQQTRLSSFLEAGTAFCNLYKRKQLQAALAFLSFLSFKEN